MTVTQTHEETKLQKLRDKVALAFEGEFMTPQIELADYARYETDEGTQFCEWGFFDPGELQFDEDQIGEVEFLRQWYGAQLVAPGYVDQTELCCFRTEREALQYLLEMKGPQSS